MDKWILRIHQKTILIGNIFFRSIGEECGVPQFINQHWICSIEVLWRKNLTMKFRVLCLQMFFCNLSVSCVSCFSDGKTFHWMVVWVSFFWFRLQLRNSCPRICIFNISGMVLSYPSFFDRFFCCRNNLVPIARKSLIHVSCLVSRDVFGSLCEKQSRLIPDL